MTRTTTPRGHSDGDDVSSVKKGGDGSRGGEGEREEGQEGPLPVVAAGPREMRGAAGTGGGGRVAGTEDAAGMGRRMRGEGKHDVDGHRVLDC